MIVLPRASSKASLHLKWEQEQEEQQAQYETPPEQQLVEPGALAAAAEAAVAQQQEQEQEQQPGPAPSYEAGSLVEALNEIKSRDVACLLEGQGGAGGSSYTSLSRLIDAAQEEMPAADAVQQLRILFEQVISTHWCARRKDQAQAASELLDEANLLLADFDISAAAQQRTAGAASSPPQQPPATAEQPAQAAATAKLPEETFFLSLDKVRECLTFNIDSNILLRSQQQAAAQQSSRRGWPAGRKRKVEGHAQAAPGKRKTKHYNPWTAELQQQLGTVLRLALRHESSPGPAQEEVAALSSALLTLADHLRTSQAGEQLQAMGATLSNAISMLQIGGFSDFEELVHDVREECHEAADAYLTMQSVDVRRGRLIAHAESFVHMLGTAIEALLNQLRADHKAALEASGAVDEDEEDELDDSFYPSSLPPSILANKEPFKGGDWRKTPYIPRPYVRLTEYDIVEPSMRDIILRKLSTKKHGGCSGQHCKSRKELGLYNVEREGFDTQCSCLARNTECDERCACQGSVECLNRAVTNRRTLRLGEDAQEVDSWGMDCYVRRNIMDAVLESRAFGPWMPPDYRALEAASPAEYAALRAAASGTGGTAASPAAAALPHAPSAAGVHKYGTSRQHGPPSTPTAAKKEEDDKMDENQHAAVVAAALASPPPTPAQVAVERRAADWLERMLLPAVNRQGENGWDLLAALQDVKRRSRAAKDAESLKAAEAVEQRIREVGYNYFRMHPKGVGLVCKREGGLPPLTFVEEYLGEIHTPWRWFEIQDAVKKITGDELPDFYNIVLERPKDDPDGYDVLFIDAAAKGAFASRMSHSCTPNCQAIVMACGGRLTIALYTLRHVHEGEELTFDYSSVTESEKEFREAICLCSTRNCRGSYLCYTGSRAFQQIMNSKHTFLHRQVIIARAGSEPLTEDDWARIKRHGLGDSALGSIEHRDRVPDWLIKWTALICEYVEEEEAHLKEDLLAHPLGIYNEVTATAEAKGVVINRLQNIVITLDKVKMVLQQRNQPRGPCLKTLTDAEAVEHLWTGPKAVARRALRGVVQALAPAAVSRTFVSAQTSQDFQKAVQRHIDDLPESLVKMCKLVLQPADDFVDARSKLMQLYKQLRAMDLENNGGLTAVADILLLYASTLHWFTCERQYKGHLSPPVPLNLQDLSLDRTQAAQQQAADSQQHTSAAGGERGLGDCGSKPGSAQDLSTGAAGSEAQESEGQHTSISQGNLRKVYRPLYVWGQLSGWFKQTVNDPTASLSAERRGTISLPDIESSFAGGKTRYGPKDRNDLIEQLDKRPDGMWRTGTIWSFKNEAKIYGSPALDAVWCELSRTGENPLPAVLAELRGVEVPLRVQAAAPSKAKGKKK